MFDYTTRQLHESSKNDEPSGCSDPRQRPLDTRSAGDDQYDPSEVATRHRRIMGRTQRKRNTTEARKVRFFFHWLVVGHAQHQ